jgi:hypothetical protein
MGTYCRIYNCEKDWICKRIMLVKKKMGLGTGRGEVHGKRWMKDLCWPIWELVVAYTI